MMFRKPKDIREVARKAGADLAGVADLAPFRGNIPTVPGELLNGYKYALSAAVRLTDGILDAIEDRPTLAYADHYREMNKKLDAIASAVVEWIVKQKHRALAVPASAIINEERLLGAVSHKAVARMAGLGWQGKSLLLVTPEFGPRVRLVTVLTDMPLMPDGPIANRCGSCRECTAACPVNAIRCVKTDSRFGSREEAVDLEKCHAHVKKNAAMPGIGARICGVCVRACPWGRKKRAGEKR